MSFLSPQTSHLNPPFHPLTSHLSPRSGQLMLVSSLVMGATLLAATTVAGLLMVYQLRQTNYAGDSTKALYAADAAIEAHLYAITRDVPAPDVVFTNGASSTVSCYNSAGNALACDDVNVSRVRAIGGAGASSRALEANLSSR